MSMTTAPGRGLGSVRFSLDGDAMLIDAREGGYSAFWKTPLPADMLVRYRARSLPPYQQNTSTSAPSRVLNA